MKELDPKVSLAGKKKVLLERYWSVKNGTYKPPQQPKQPKSKQTQQSQMWNNCKEMVDMLEMHEFYEYLDNFGISLKTFELPANYKQVFLNDPFIDERIKKAKVELCNAMTKPKHSNGASKSKNFGFENLDDVLDDENVPNIATEHEPRYQEPIVLNNGNPTTQVITTPEHLEQWKCLNRTQLQNHSRTIDVMEKLRHIQAVFQDATDLDGAKALLIDFNWDDLDNAIIDMLIESAKTADFTRLRIDPTAMSLFKKHFPREKNKFTAMTSMNGFCLDSSFSYGLSGTPNFEFELRLKGVKEMIEKSDELEKEADLKGWAESYKDLFQEIKDICNFGVCEDQFGTLDFNGEYSGLYSISALARATKVKIDVYYPAENGMCNLKKYIFCEFLIS